MAKRVGIPILPEYLRILKLEKTAMPTITKKMEPYNITGFSPIDITGLDLWLDGNDPTTMFNASNGGANVSHDGYIWRWEDKSRNGNHVYTMTGVPGNFTQPQYYENLTNYKGGVTFSNSVLTNLVQAPYPVDVYIVLSLCNYNNVSISALTRTNMNVFSVKYPGGTFGSNKDWNSLAYGLMNSGQGINYSNKWVNNSSNYIRTPNTVPTEVETSMGFLLLNWGISNSDYRINRYTTTLKETNTYTTWATYANSNTAFRYFIGGIDYSANDSNFTGSICEILSFSNKLNVSNRTLVESYLANKWGLQKNIPVTHPGRLGNFPSYTEYSLSTIDGIRGYDKRAVANLVYVQPPGPLTLSNFTTTLNGGVGAQYSLNMGWTNPGGAADYYTVMICNSTDNSTWQDLEYYSHLNRLTSNTLTFCNSIIIEDMYYNYSVTAFNKGGSNYVTSDSYLNAPPGKPTVATPTAASAPNNCNDLSLTWYTSSFGGTPLTYNISIYENNTASKGPLFFQFSSIVASNTTMIFKTSDNAFFYSLLTDNTYSYKTNFFYTFTATASNSLGLSADSDFSSYYEYPSRGN